MERRLTKGLWLDNDSLTGGNTILDEGNGNLTAAITAVGSDNRLKLTITNDDASSFYCSAWTHLYPRDGIMTEYFYPE